MLVKIRKSVFETNSSSTHAFSILKKGVVCNPEAYDEEYDLKFRIISPKHKLLFLYGVIKCFYRDHSKTKEVKDLLELLVQVYADKTNKSVKEVKDFIKQEDEKDEFTSLCARYFNNDCLMECFCCMHDGKHNDVFAKLFFDISNDYREGFEKILSDEYYIDLTEFWAGGVYEKENIDY